MSDELIEIVDKLLNLNPFFRESAAELIKLKVFDEVREKKSEKKASLKIKLDIDQDCAFDYDAGVSHKY